MAACVYHYRDRYHGAMPHARFVADCLEPVISCQQPVSSFHHKVESRGLTKRRFFVIDWSRQRPA